MIDLTRLQIFLSVAENLSFSEAAQRLHISQPTVSHHIKALEQALGVELFNRSSHTVKLTGAGAAARVYDFYGLNFFQIYLRHDVLLINLWDQVLSKRDRNSSHCAIS